MMVEARRYAAAVKPLGRAVETKQAFAAALHDAARPLVRAARPRNERDVQKIDALVVSALSGVGIDPVDKLGLFARERVKEIAVLPWQAALFGKAPMFQEFWTGTNGDPWNTDRWTVLQQDGTSILDIQSNEGRMSPQGDDYQAIVVEANVDLVNFDLTAAFRLTSANEQYHGINFLGDAVASDDCYVIEIGSNFFNVYDKISGTPSYFLQETSITWGASAWNLRIQRIGSALRVKRWQGEEPGAWNLDTTDGSYTSGGLVFYAVNGGSSTARPIFWDNLRVFQA